MRWRRRFRDNVALRLVSIVGKELIPDILRAALFLIGKEDPEPSSAGLSMPSPVGLRLSSDDFWPSARGTSRHLRILYPVYAATRNSAGFMTRKLSVTVSRRACHWAGTSSRRKLRTALQKPLYVGWHWLWVTALCIAPHNRSIGLRCGQ